MLTDETKPCEQYVFEARGKRQKDKPGEPLLVYESPLEGSGTYFMIQTEDGEERGSFRSKKTGWNAVLDMRKHIEGVSIASMRRRPVSERPGRRLSL